MSEQYDPLAAYLARGTLDEIREIFNEWFEFQKKLSKYQSNKPNRTGEVNRKDLLKDLNISPNTLAKWEDNGLNRIQRDGTIFYLLEDLHKFNY
ncbi:transcriptional regulator [Lactococcus petauri]|uniref:transcriptional regulator n=1 Tax=Lactococcus petauri TaxID=1940789 RepID=UPI003243F1C9